MPLRHTAFIVSLAGLFAAGWYWLPRGRAAADEPTPAATVSAVQDDSSNVSAPADESTDATGEATKSTGFSRATVDVGIVVSDLKKSQAFYTDVVGLKQLGAFDASAEIGRKSGLSNNQPLSVLVMGISEEPTATRVKLMEFPQAPGQRPDNRFIHSTYGIRYLTFFVDDMDAAVARAKQAGVKPIAEGPVDLEGVASGAFLTVVRDPDGNFVEFVGPKPGRTP